MMKMEKNKISERERLPLLDFLRIILCAMILLFHAVIKGFWNIPQKSFLYSVLSTGAIYMDTFFILSGFLLFYLHGDNFDSFNPLRVKNFYLKRFIKIYPPYIVYTLITIFIANSFNWLILPIEILGIQGYFPCLFKVAGNGGTWFISCLFTSYLMFPFLAKLVLVTKQNVLVIFFLYLLVVYIAVLATVFKIGWMPVYINPIYRMCEFTIGMYLAKIFLQSNKKNNTYYIVWATIAVFLIIILVPILYKNNYINHTAFGHNFISYNCLTIPVSLLMIFCLSCIQNNFCARMNNSRMLLFLAELTFPFYVYQGLAQVYAKRIYAYTNITLLAVFVITTFVFSIIAYIFFDKLIVKKLKRLLRGI